MSPDRMPKDVLYTFNPGRLSITAVHPADGCRLWMTFTAQVTGHDGYHFRQMEPVNCLNLIRFIPRLVCASTHN